MAESHGTREFIGGGELGPHPETAAQTHGAPTAWKLHRKWSGPQACFAARGRFQNIIIFSKAHARAVAPKQNRFFSATLARAFSRRLSRGVFVECVPPERGKLKGVDRP